MNIFQNAIALAIISSVLYGINGPVMRAAGNAGASAGGMALMYGIGCFTVAFLTKGNAVMFPTGKATILAAIVGIVCGAAFFFIGLAFKRPDGNVSILTTIIAGHCLVSVLVAILFMGELSRINFWRFALGALLVLLGVYIVSTSTKTA